MGPIQRPTICPTGHSNCHLRTTWRTVGPHTRRLRGSTGHRMATCRTPRMYPHPTLPGTFYSAGITCRWIRPATTVCLRRPARPCTYRHTTQTPLLVMSSSRVCTTVRTTPGQRTLTAKCGCQSRGPTCTPDLTRSSR